MLKKILIAGGGGYIGTELTDHFLKKGHEVIVLDRFFFGRTLDDLKKKKKLKVIKGDVRYPSQSLFKNVSVVINLAAISNDPASELDPKVTKDINYKGAVNLAKAAKAAKVKRYILSSSCSVYGTGENKLNERSPLAPVSEYAKSKIDAEKSLLKLSGKNFIVAVPRLATIYGLSNRRMRFDLIINMMSLYAWRDQKIFVLGGGKQWRPLIHIKDAVKAFYMLATEPNGNKINREIFNVGSNEQNFQVSQVANLFKKHFPNLEIETAPDDPDQRSYNVSFDKICKKLGYKAEKNVDQGIKEVKNALETGAIADELRTSTLQQYKYLLEADKILNEVKLNGKLF